MAAGHSLHWRHYKGEGGVGVPEARTPAPGSPPTPPPPRNQVGAAAQLEMMGRGLALFLGDSATP